MPGENTKATIQFGPAGLEYAAYTAINELQQVRQEINAEELQELAFAMMANGQELDPSLVEKITSDAFDLGNPVILGRHDRFSAKRYIRDHGDFWSIPQDERVSPSDLVRLDDSRILLSIAGHRRRGAIGILAARFGIDLEDVEIAATVHDNITFDEALAKQARENNYQRPPAQDEARIIGRLYRHLLQQSRGHAPSVRSLGARLGYKETKVRDALAFDSLPARIQAFTEDGVLSYGTVKQLKPLHEAFIRYYRDYPPEEAEKNIVDDLETFCNTMVNMELKGNIEQRRAALIQNTVLEILGQAEYQQQAFLLDLEFSPSARRQASSEQLTKLALKVIAHQAKKGDLPDKVLAELADAVEKAKTISETRQGTPFQIFAQG